MIGNRASVRSWAVFLIGVGVVGTGGSAQAQPAITSVSLTIQARSAPQVYCPECVRFSGRVTSPKSACRANRTVGNTLRYRAGSASAGKTYRDPHFVETDGQGRWSIVVGSGEPLAWLEVTVPKIRVGAVTCQAARAKVTLGGASNSRV